MKQILTLLIASITILSCSNKSDTSSELTENDSNNSLTADTVFQKIKINTTLPFGCPKLLSNKYPKHWDADAENYGRLAQPQGKEFEGISACFEKLNKVDDCNFKPEILNYNHLKIGADNTNTIYFDTILQQNINALKYRLPNIGNYACFYYYEESQNDKGNYGNLLLVDAETLTGTTVNIYYTVSGDQYVKFRYFYVEGHTIKIYEGACYDNGCDLAEAFIINITTDGQIVINEL